MFFTYINEVLDNLKSKDYKLCAATTYNRPCRKYTPNKHKYCEEHYELLRLSCEKYHFLNKELPANKSTLAEVELNMRREYVRRFAIFPDLGHTQWEQVLKQIIASASDNNGETESESDRFMDELHERIYYYDPDTSSPTIHQLGLDGIDVQQLKYPSVVDKLHLMSSLKISNNYDWHINRHVDFRKKAINLSYYNKQYGF